MRARWVGIGGVALLFGLALVLLRGEPIIASDQGVFISVAARLLDGDRLYTDVIENKDPLFFYTYAAALWVGGWRGPFLLDGVWLGVAALSMALLLREMRLPRSAAVAGFFIYPLALVGSWYTPGHTMLAGLAFAPLAAWLWVRGNLVASGAVLGVVVLFKMHIAAVAAAPLVAFLLLAIPSGPRVRALARAAVGLAATLGGAALVLSVRGELRAYLDTITYQVYYSRALSHSAGFFGRMRDHLDVVLLHFRAERWQLPATLLVLGIFAVVAYLAWNSGSRERLIAVTALITLASALGTLALTAYWFHHNQMLAYPATLIAATFVSVAVVTLGKNVGAGVATVCVLFALSSMVRSDRPFEVSPAWTAEPVSASATALEQARSRFFDPSDRISYMVFGGNSENAHAVFIADKFDLVCRWFHLYPHSTGEQLDETTACSERERPMLILVTLGFYDPLPGAPKWEAFVSHARQLLRSRYERVVTVHPGFEVWKRRDLAAP